MTEEQKKTLDELSADVIEAARHLNEAAFTLRRWGNIDSATDSFRAEMKHIDRLEESRMRLKRAIDKLDLEVDRQELLRHAEKAERRKADEELGFRPPCLTIYDDSARDWGCDTFGKPVYSPRHGYDY